jgi:hypothetical protein
MHVQTPPLLVPEHNTMTLVPPTWLPGPRLEVSVHVCPARALADVRGVFPALPATDAVLILPVFQPTRHDLTSVGADVDAERDALLEHVRTHARPRALVHLPTRACVC